MKVLKFGGTSIGSVDAVKTVLTIISKELAVTDGQLVVVTSAMSGVTNSLIEMAQLALKGHVFESLLQAFEDKHLDLIKNLLPIKEQSEVITHLKLHVNRLEEILSGVRALSELSASALDQVVSFGELCATYIVSEYLKQAYPDTQFIDTRTLIVTDSNFGNATVNFDKTNPNIQAYFSVHKSKLVVVTGFISANGNKQVTTLGRGGSDYTAAIFGGALNADEIQIWTDVDGFMTADPRMVAKAFSLQQLSYTEAMELSYFGAKVIYPPTMVPAFLKQIPIVIKNTFNPSFHGTFIKNETIKTKSLIRGISSINKISLINIEGSGFIGMVGFSGKLFTLLAKNKINIILITQASSEHSICIAVATEDAIKAKQIIEQEFQYEMSTGKMDRPLVRDQLSIIAVVGEDMKQHPGVSAKLFNALGRNGVNVVAIAQGSSEYNISIAIDQVHISKALNAIHESFFIDVTEKTLNVFVVGVGNIGKTLLKQINAQYEYLIKHKSLRVKIVGVCNSRKMYIDVNGIDLNNWDTELFAKGIQTNLQEMVAQIAELDLPNSVFVDNTASKEIVKIYAELLSKNVSVVTCNKIGNSSDYAYYIKLKELAFARSVSYLYETNVGAGLPIIKTLNDLMLSGDHVLKIEAVLSGTISYIFNNFNTGKLFHEVVAAAQKAGLTEPDPRDDLSGSDFMRKMLILARECGYPLEAKDAQIQPILTPLCLQAASIESFYNALETEKEHFNALSKKAADEGKVLRYIGILENAKVSIELKAVDNKHPFHSLSGSDNIISFTTERYKERPLVVKGPGAGAEVTAAGVFADLVSIGLKH